MIHITVDASYGGRELFDVISAEFPALDAKLLKRAFKDAAIALNGKNARGNEKAAAGDKVDIFLSDEQLGIDLTPDVVYQDENFVIADKPAGLLCVSDTGEKNAVSMVEEIMKLRGEYSLEALMVPYLVYPLEKEASGLLIMAKHEDAYLFLSQAMAQRRLTRHYVCAVKGEAKESAELLAYHTQDRAAKTARILERQTRESRPIVTRYQRLAKGGGMALLRARPVTNCLHQVRAHLAFEGLPVIGDETYGDRKFNAKLRARTIALWLKEIIFEIGTGHEYAYLNGRKFESHVFCFPKCVYDAGLIETVQ